MNWLQYFQLKDKQKKVTKYAFIIVLLMNAWIVAGETLTPECEKITNICTEDEKAYYYPWKVCETYCGDAGIFLRTKMAIHTVYNNMFFPITDFATAIAIGWVYFKIAEHKIEKQNSQESEEEKNDDK